MTKNIFYLTEEGKKVIYDGNFLDFDPYQKKIFLDDIRKILQASDLKEIKKFDDWYTFEGDHISVNVMLRSEENFYDDDQAREFAGLKEYMNSVQMLNLQVLKPLIQKDFKTIEQLVNTFNLTIFYPDKQKKIKDPIAINQLVNF